MMTLQRRRSGSTANSAGVAIGFGIDADPDQGSSSPSRRFSSASTPSTSVWVHDAPSSCRNDYRRSNFACPLPSSSWSGNGAICSSSSAPIKYLAVVTLLSWVAALRLLSDGHAVLADVRQRERRQRQTLLESQKSLASLKGELQHERQYVRNLERTVEALDREVRIVSELEDAAEAGVLELPPDDEELLKVWFEHRVEGLQHRVEQLQLYLQDFSRVEAIQRFGPGPHHVRFSVQFGGSGADEEEQPAVQSLVVELAPLDSLPHAVYFFLDMVHLRLWDDSVLLHRESSPHIVAAAPLDYKTGDSKLHHLSFLGWTRLGFPEYSLEWTHQPYTVGFTHMGPNFYVNAGDNSPHHGPGGQGHHELPTDADPCFGRVVEGRGVVDELLKRQQMAAAPAAMPAANGAAEGGRLLLPPQLAPPGELHSWARLVSIELVPNFVAAPLSSS